MAFRYDQEKFIEEVSNKKIKVFISSSSFEKRCFVIAEHLVSSNINKSIFFYNYNEVPEIIYNANELCKLYPGKSEKISLNSENPLGNFVTISETISQLIIQNQNQNFLIDSTTFTHETLLILLKIFELDQNFLGELYIVYVGASGYSINEINEADKWLSKGIKTIRTILGYSGFTDPTAKNHLMILFGFESERTKKIIDEYEYEYVSLGFGDVDESIQDNHQKLNFERHKKLLEDYPNAKEFSFSLVNPYDTKNALLKHISKYKYENYNTVIAPLNNKISTIGACLAAIENSDIQLAYAQPLIYNIDGYSEPNNQIYFFQLKLV